MDSNVFGKIFIIYNYKLPKYILKKYSDKISS